MCVKKLSFGIAYKVATYWKQYRLRLAIIYLHQASMLQDNMCIPSWNRGISDLSMSKQVDLTGNYAANMDHFTCGKEAKASSNNTKWLVQLWWYTLQQTSNDNSWSTIYDSATSTFSPCLTLFCKFWLLFLSTRSFWVSLTRKAEEMQSISWMTLFGILFHILLKKLTLLMTIVLKKCSFFKELFRADSLEFPQNYIACGAWTMTSETNKATK